MYVYSDVKTFQVNVPGLCVIFGTFKIVFYFFTKTGKDLYFYLSGHDFCCLIIPLSPNTNAYSVYIISRDRWIRAPPRTLNLPVLLHMCVCVYVFLSDDSLTPL